MFNPFLTLFIFAELSFYLLIAQTGVVELFHSDLSLVVYLPVGGVIGTLIGAFTALHIRTKAYLFLFLQLLVALLYPNLNFASLFALGIAVGGLSPIIIQVFKNGQKYDFIIALTASYLLGTLLFTSDVTQRGSLAIILTAFAIFGYEFKTFISKKVNLSFQKKYFSYPLIMMISWVFFDSSLFETLSRSQDMSIWRGGYSHEIMLFHALGIFAAFIFRFQRMGQITFIFSLFFVSYLLYFTKEPLLLSMVYPFVISYYNVILLQSLIKIKNFQTIGIYMVWIGWVASGLGLLIALTHTLAFVTLLFIAPIIGKFFLQNKLQKRNLSMNKLFILLLLLPLSLFSQNLQLKSGFIQAHTSVFGDDTIEPATKKIIANLSMNTDAINSLHGTISFNLNNFISDKPDRDEHMLEMFDAKKYTTISLNIQNLHKTDKEYILYGILTMHGVQKAVQIKTKIIDDANNINLNSHFTVKVSDYGMKPPSLLFFTVKDAVSIDANVTLTR